MEPYKFREITTEDAWNRFAVTFPRSTFIDAWDWGVFQKELGFQYMNIGVFDNDSIEALLPVTIVKAKRGRYMHLRHAPMLNWRDEKLVTAVVAYLRELALEHKLWFIRISPLIDENPENREILKSHGLVPSLANEVDAEHTLYLDIQSNDEAKLLADMRKNTRYYIRKAEKMGIEIVQTDTLEYFDEFWAIFMDAVKRNDWVAFTKEYVKREFEIFAKSGNARMFLSKYKGKFIAASIFTYFNGQSFYHHSGSLSEFRDVPATYLLQWESIKYAKSQDMREYNFWGVVDRSAVNHPWYGLSLFKRGFGGNERLSIHAHDLVLHPFGHATRAYEWIEKKKNGY